MNHLPCAIVCSMRRASVAAAILVGLLVAAPAHADKRISSEVRIARAFWAHRDLMGCPRGIKFRVVAFRTRHLVGLGGNCGFKLSSYWYRRWRTRHARDVMRRDAAIECMYVTHEVAHALGSMGHTRFGIMSPYLLRADGTRPIPRACWRWANFFSLTNTHDLLVLP